MRQSDEPQVTNFSTVYVVNDGGHDFSAAESFGPLVFLSKGPINRYATTQMYRKFSEKLKDSKPHDYILCTALTQMNMIAAAIMAAKHGKLNLLIHKNNGYVSRTVNLTSLI